MGNPTSLLVCAPPKATQCMSMTNDSCISKPKCILINARSLCCKLPEFRALLGGLEYDLIFVTETWLWDYIPDSVILSGQPYHLVRRDRGTLGGGVLTAVRSELMSIFQKILILLRPASHPIQIYCWVYP